MKHQNKIALIAIAFAFASTAASAQPARIDYSQPSNSAWHDQDGNPSVETGYDGRSEYRPRDSYNRDNNRDQNYNRDHNYNRDRNNNNYENDRRYENRPRANWRDTNRRSRFSNERHNGYYLNNRWHYGAPNINQYNRRGFALGYHPWMRGQSLGIYNTRFEQVDYQRHNLRQPPRGYRWVQDDRGDYLLAALVGGLIAEIVINGGN